MMNRFLVAAALLIAATAGAGARNNGPTLRDQQQAACYDDVQRLCSAAMPDVAKVTACMKPKKAVVSAKCRALWDVK